MAADDFQSKYASLMESMIKSAVAETTKLFETMVDELKAEISTIRKENEHLKIRCTQFENDKSQPRVYTGGTGRLPGPTSTSEKRDTAVQCDLVPLQDIIVEQCQPLRCSLTNPEQQHDKETDSSLQKDRYSETHEEENSQVALDAVKEEVEEDELTTVCGQVQGNNVGSPLPSPCGTETEGPHIEEVMSLHDTDLLTLNLNHLKNKGLRTHIHSCEPEHSSVIPLPLNDTLEEELETLHHISEMGTHEELTTSKEKQLRDVQGQLPVEPPEKGQLVSVSQESQREADVSVNNHTNATLQQYADVHQEEEQLIAPVLLKEVNCEELESGSTEDKDGSQPEMSSHSRRGTLPRKAKNQKSLQQKAEEIQSPSLDVHTDQNEVNFSSIRTENSCTVDTIHAITGSSRAPSVHPKDTISIITPSLQDRANPKRKDVENNNICSLPVCFGKHQLLESQQHCADKTGEAVQAPANKGSPANKTQNTLPPKSPQAPSLRPRGRCTSVTLEDAMLLVEAMYQSQGENAVSSPPTTHGVPRVATLQTVDEIPALRETPPLPVESHEVEGTLSITEQSLPSVETISATCLTTHATQTSESRAHIKVEIQQHDDTVSSANITPELLSTVASQTRMQPSQQYFLPPVITLAAPSKTQSYTIPPKIFVSSLKSHALSSAQLSAVVSAVVSAQKSNSPPLSTGGPHGTPALSSVPQKTIIITTRKPPPLTTATPTVNQSMTRPQHKIIIIPRQMSPVVSQKQQSQTLALKAKPSEPAPTVMVQSEQLVSSSQQLNISVDTLKASEPAPAVTVPSPPMVSSSQRLSMSVDTHMASDEVHTTSQERDNISDNLDSQKPPKSVSETTDAPAEPSANLKTLVPPEPEAASPSEGVPPPDEWKYSAMVRLTRLPFTMSTEETVLVSRLLSNGSSKTPIPTQVPSSAQEKPLSDAPAQSTNFVSLLSTMSEPTACLPQNDSPIQENQSSALIQLSSITSKDTSDPHSQMTKSQFLAQLEVSPIATEACSNSSEDKSAVNGKRLQKRSLVARLRSHLKGHLQARRNEPNPETTVEMDTTCTAPKKQRLENNRPNDENQASVPVPLSPEETNDDPTSVTLWRSGPCKNEPTSETASLEKIESTSASPRSSSSRPQKAESVCVSPSKSSLINGTNRQLSSINSTPLSRRMSTVTKDVPDTEQVKRKLIGVSPRRYSITISEKTNSKTGSPSFRPRVSEDAVSVKKSGGSIPSKKNRLFRDGNVCKNTFKLVNAKKLAKAAKVKTIAKMKKSNQSLFEIGVKTSQLGENQASSKDVKKVIVTGIWTPPLLPASETTPTGGAKPLDTATKKEKGWQNQSIGYPLSPSLHTMPIRAPPIVSPLQPLSVIGGRLLKNQCGECGRVLSSSEALESHVSLHTRRRPFSCKLCGKFFRDSKGLKRHDRVHRNGRIHVCSKCGKGFVYTFCLTKHLQMVHGRVKPFSCKVCKKGFFTKRDMEAHMRIHTGEKPFQCNICERKFTRKVELNVHLRWHNGEKRHWCPYCGKGFLDFNNLKRHKYIHTGEKPHACPHCPKHFTQSGHLKKHVRNVHKIQ